MHINNARTNENCIQYWFFQLNRLLTFPFLKKIMLPQEKLQKINWNVSKIMIKIENILWMQINKFVVQYSVQHR